MPGEQHIPENELELLMIVLYLSGCHFVWDIIRGIDEFNDFFKA